MATTELKDIEDYWTKKYPDVFIILFANDKKTKYYGKMVHGQHSLNLNADSIGSLISRGEDFLRRIIK